MSEEPRCEYTYRSGRPCGCKADFNVISYRVGIREMKDICVIHLGFYLMTIESKDSAVERIVPREERA